MTEELKGAELTFTALQMLYGKEGESWCYYEGDEQWWALRLFINRN